MKISNTNLETENMNEDIITSTSGLIARMNMNSKNELKDYDEWLGEVVIRHSSDFPANILDVGCGVGKQTILLQKLFSEAHIFSVDKSKDSLKIVESKSKTDKQTSICSDIDNFKEYCLKNFDIIVSSYAIYYSKDLESLLVNYSKSLKRNGSIFLFGYSHKSNAELIDIINGISDIKTAYYDNFISNEILDAIKSIYEIKLAEFENQVVFKSITEFNMWFQSCELYLKCDNAKVSLIIDDIIRTKGEFRLTKDTLGVVLKLHPS